MKLPRKLKKKLKKALLETRTEWKSSEVRIDGIRKTSFPQIKDGFAMHKGTIVTSFRLV